MTTATNGIQADALAEFRDAVTAKPGAFTRTVRARADWDGGFRAAIHIRDHAPIIADEPTRLGGTNAGPTPGELVLASLSSCLVVGYALQAHLRGITIRSLSVEVEGVSDPTHFLGCGPGPNGTDSGYHQMRVNVRLEADADQATLEGLHQDVVRTSPVGNTLAGQVAIDARLVPTT